MIVIIYSFLAILWYEIPFLYFKKINTPNILVVTVFGSLICAIRLVGNPKAEFLTGSASVRIQSQTASPPSIVLPPPLPAMDLNST